MIKRIFIVVAIGMVLTLLALWLWLGGWTRIANFVHGMSNPIDILFGDASGSYVIHLPGEIVAPQGADISKFTDPSGSGDVQSQIDELRGEYGSLKQQSDDIKNYGEPSPYRGKVSLSVGDAEESSPAREYVVVDASAWNNSPISLANWSLQSMLTGVRVQIPLAATGHLMGAINSVAPVSLDPGTTAIITTGASPAGVSFRESRCTGYLQQLQTYEPTLTNACPVPREALKYTAANVRQYGESCIEFVDQLPQCQFPDRVPASLSVQCQLLLANTFSYNGCVATYRNERDFNLDVWRLYLGLGMQQWRDTHDIIRLLDADGRTVDAVTY